MRIKLDIPIDSRCLADMLNATASRGVNDYTVEYVCTDTREVQRGDLFIALSGEIFNGEDYLADAKTIGAYTVSTKSEHTNFTVNNTLTSLSMFANKYKKLLNVKSTVAITGSVGKTTTKELTLKLLSTKFKVHGTHKNLNNEIGVPLTILSAPQNTDILVLEAGMNHSGELRRISECIEPDIAVITNVGTAHIGNLGSRKKIAEAKEEILYGMPKPYLLAPAKDCYITKYPFMKTVSASDKNADFYLFENKDLYGFRSKYNLIEGFKIGSKMPHVPACLSFALSVCSVLNMSNEEILNAVNSLVFNDEEKVHKVGTLTLIDDSYNCSPESAISALNMLKKASTGKKSAVFGDMLELGEFSDELHFELGVAAANAGISKLYLIGEKSNSVKKGALIHGMSEETVFINEDPNDPQKTAMQILKNSDNETILLKGSRKLRLERIIEILKEY